MDGGGTIQRDDAAEANLVELALMRQRRQGDILQRREMKTFALIMKQAHCDLVAAPQQVPGHIEKQVALVVHKFLYRPV